ncbi:MAG: Terminase small subunit [Vampirovibrio sp.]|jgi:hypothetical protein|nr:Terminase small subunit [Vampirovibrio sp.]
MAPAGRPSDYSIELGNKICEELIKPRTLTAICNDAKMPSRATVFRWLNEHKEFRDNYTRARAIQADAYVDEIFKIADTTDADNVCDEYGNIKPNHEWIQRSRLRVDTRKWYASKVAPKLYGNKVEQTIVGDPEKPVHHQIDIKALSQDEVMDFIRKKTQGE